MPSNEPRKDLAKSFKRIATLKEEDRAVLNTMFYEGRGVPSIIKMFKKTLGMWADVSDNTLEKYLYRYKQDVIDKNLASMVPQDKGTGLVMLQNTKESVDTLEELAQMVMVQKARVQKMAVREKTMPMLFSTLGGEIKTLAALIQQFAELSFDLGMLNRTTTKTRIMREGGSTVVESQGRKNVQLSIQHNNELESAAAVFFEVLDIPEVSDGGN